MTIISNRIVLILYVSFVPTIQNPPPIDSSFSPEVWKEWFETTFRGDDDDIEVAAVTIALDNERLINALVDRRALIREYQNFPVHLIVLPRVRMPMERK